MIVQWVWARLSSFIVIIEVVVKIWASNIFVLLLQQSACCATISTGTPRFRNIVWRNLAVTTMVSTCSDSYHWMLWMMSMWTNIRHFLSMSTIIINRLNRMSSRRPSSTRDATMKLREMEFRIISERMVEFPWCYITNWFCYKLSKLQDAANNALLVYCP